MVPVPFSNPCQHLLHLQGQAEMQWGAIADGDVVSEVSRPKGANHYLSPLYPQEASPFDSSPQVCPGILQTLGEGLPCIVWEVPPQREQARDTCARVT